MPVIRFLDSGKQIELPEGVSIMEAAHAAGVPIESPCDRTGVCGKCRVRLALASLARVRCPESSALSAELRACGHVLACETLVHGDIDVEESVSGADESLRVLAHGSGVAQELAPAIRKQFVLAENVTHVFVDNELLGVESEDTVAAAYGIVVDIGTTTLVVSLVDLASGHELACVSGLNPQARHAQDVLSRISFASRGDGLETMRRAVTQAIDDMIKRVAGQAGVDMHNVYEVVYSGNTCMLHLGVGVSPATLGKHPYTPALGGHQYFAASDVGLSVARFGRVYLPPVISAYVGADITAGILGMRLHELSGVSLLVDIGTNGEMALSCNGRLRATSTAAGPAFEGMNISCGMRAGKGAVERVTLGEDGSVQYQVIGGSDGCRATGLCGSGLLDLTAELVRLGLIRSNGRLAEPETAAAHPALLRRLVRKDDRPAFELTPDVFLTQKDVRQVQLAKGAVRSGIEILLQDSGVAPERVDRVLIAGAFGYHLSPASLLTLGMLPKAFEGRIEFVGNTSKTGGHALLTNAACREELAALVTDVEVVELADSKNFDRVFAQCMGF